MTKRRVDEQQAQAIKERLVQHARGISPSPAQATPEAAAESANSSDRHARARQHFLGSSLETLVARQTIEAISVTQIAPELQPGLRQPRMIPLPDQLVVNGETPPAYTELVAELRDLGESLREHQIQPIVVYPGTNADLPEARYLILVGQRRWTAAQLVGMRTINAVVIEPPAPLERITLQFAENEAREDFSDIERAWTIRQLREAMGGDSIGIAEVAAKLNIKRSRAYQLLRMLVFPPDQQQIIALLRLQERQLLPLIDALHQTQIKPEQAESVIHRLQEIAAERALAGHQLAAQETNRSVEPPRRSGIDAATVARLLARVNKEGQHNQASSGEPRWCSLLRDDVERLNRKLRRASDHVDQLGADSTTALIGQLQKLQQQIQLLVHRLGEAEENDS